MNFKKKEGKIYIDVLEGLSNFLQKEFESNFTINQKIRNNFTYMDKGENRYINITYAYSSTSLVALIHGFSIFLERILGKFKYKQSIYIRQPVEIESDDDGSYYFSIRFVILND